MAPKTVPKPGRGVWAIAKRDHNVAGHDELRELGYSEDAIRHRVDTGRLHRKGKGVYAVGSPNLSKYGRWMVAIKRCGPGTVLSHLSAAVLWGIWKKEPREITVTVPRARNPRVPNVSRRDLPSRHVTRHHGIPVTTVLRTLIDLATTLTREEMERLIGQADAMNLLRADALRKRLERETCRGARILKEILDRDSYALATPSWSGSSSRSRSRPASASPTHSGASASTAWTSTSRS
jgi:predicted transcriptional regulator of viral defense system